MYKIQLTKEIKQSLQRLQVIKDYQLFMVVGVLLCVDLAIMTTWQVSDPFYRATKQLEPYVSIDFIGSDDINALDVILCLCVKSNFR